MKHYTFTRECRKCNKPFRPNSRWNHVCENCRDLPHRLKRRYCRYCKKELTKQEKIRGKCTCGEW